MRPIPAKWYDEDVLILEFLPVQQFYDKRDNEVRGAEVRAVVVGNGPAGDKNVFDVSISELQIQPATVRELEWVSVGFES